MIVILVTEDGTQFPFEQLEPDKIDNIPGIIYFAEAATPMQPIYVSQSANLRRWMDVNHYFEDAATMHQANCCFIHQGPDTEPARRDAKRELVRRYGPVMNPPDDVI